MTIPATSTRRAELAAFLRARRSELSPADVGLPPGPRRRTPGLRREEVAQLAGVGVTWYTWLEQGRPINASAQVLDAVARVLRLGPAGHAHLYRLAGMPDVAPAAGVEMAPQVQQVLDAVDPLPAAVYDGRFTLLAANDRYAELFPAIAAATGLERNALWQLLVHPERSMLLTLEAIPRMAAIVRGHFSRHLGEPEWEFFVTALSEASPEFVRLWSTHEVAEPGPQRKRFHCPSVGVLELETVSFAVAGTPEARMIVYTPATPESADRLARLRSGRPGPG